MSKTIKAVAEKAAHELEATRRRIATTETAAEFYQSVVAVLPLSDAARELANRAIDTANEEARFLRSSIGGAAA